MTRIQLKRPSKKRSRRGSKRRSGKGKKSATLSMKRKSRKMKRGNKKRRKSKKKRGGGNTERLVNIFEPNLIIGTLNCLGEYNNPFEFKKILNEYDIIETLWLFWLKYFISNITNITDQDDKDDNKILRQIGLNVNNSVFLNTDLYNNNFNGVMTNFSVHILTLKNLYTKYKTKYSDFKGFFNHVVDYDNKKLKSGSNQRENYIKFFCNYTNDDKLKNVPTLKSLNFQEVENSKNIMDVNDRITCISIWDYFSSLFMNKINEMAPTNTDIKNILDFKKQLCSETTIINTLNTDNSPLKGRSFIIACQEFTEKCHKSANTERFNVHYYSTNNTEELAFISSSDITLNRYDNLEQRLRKHLDTELKGILEIMKTNMKEGEKEGEKKENQKKLQKAFDKTIQRIMLCEYNNVVYVNIHAQHMSEKNVNKDIIGLKEYKLNYSLQKKIYEKITEYIYKTTQNKCYILSDTNMEVNLNGDNSKATTRKLRSSMQVQFNKSNDSKIFEKDHIYTNVDGNYKKLEKSDGVAIYPDPSINVYYPTNTWLSDHLLVYLYTKAKQSPK